MGRLLQGVIGCYRWGAGGAVLWVCAQCYGAQRRCGHGAVQGLRLGMRRCGVARGLLVSGATRRCHPPPPSVPHCLPRASPPSPTRRGVPADAPSDSGNFCVRGVNQHQLTPEPHSCGRALISGRVGVPRRRGGGGGRAGGSSPCAPHGPTASPRRTALPALPDADRPAVAPPNNGVRLILSQWD